MVNPPNDKQIDIEGERGKSLFWRPLKPALDDVSLRKIQQKQDDYLAKYKQTSDDRALAIIGALSVETELDNFLSKWIKDYKYLIDKEDFSFSFKVDLAISLRLIPKKILNAIEPIRKIRNIFAHSLNIDTFEKAKEVDSDSFEMLYNKVRVFEVWSKNDVEETFRQLIFLVILGLDIYAEHLAKVQDYVSKSRNLNEIIRI